MLYKKLLNLGIFGFVLACAPAVAHSGAHGVVKERMDGMVGMAAQFKIIGEMVLGRRDFDAGIAGAAADEIAVRALLIPHQFPQGSAGSPSDARLTIWQDWEMFAQLGDMLVVSSKQLSIAAPGLSGTDALRPHFTAIGKSCKGCHADFRD